MSPRKLLFAGVGYLLLSVFYTFPMVCDVHRANRFDSPDAALNAWILAWDLHQLARDPLDLFHANIFYPDEDTLAYSENLLAAALMVAPLGWMSDNPIFLFNMALLAALTTSGLLAFALARHLTRDDGAAALAGLVFAFAPYRWAHVPHIQLQIAFAIPAAFYFTHRLFEGAGARAAVGLGLSVTASFGSSGYYAIYLLTALPLVSAVEIARIPREYSKRAAPYLLLAAAVAVLTTAPLARPYLAKMNEGAIRSLEITSRYAAGAREYFSSFSRLHFFLPESEEPLFPGLAAAALSCLALAASFRGFATRAERRKSVRDEWIYFAVGVLGVLLSLGPSGGLFSVLFHLLPPYQVLRVPSRAAILFLLAVAVLAAFGLSRIRSRVIRVGIMAVAAAECYAGPLPWSFDPPEIPAIYKQVASLSEPGALVELPLPPPELFQENVRYVYRSVHHWRPLVNGYSGFVPSSYRNAFNLLMRSDFLYGIRWLSDRGVRFALVHTSRLGPRMERQVRDAESEGALELVAAAGNDRLYRIQER